MKSEDMIDIKKIIRDNINIACKKPKPIPIGKLVKDCDIELVESYELYGNISGQIERKEEGSYKISFDAFRGIIFQRLTIAHFLAHYLLHAHLIGNALYETIIYSDNKFTYESVKRGWRLNRNITNRHQAKANKLAAFMLMPYKLMEAFADEMKISLFSMTKSEKNILAKELMVPIFILENRFERLELEK